MLRTALLLLLILSIAYAQENLRAPVALVRSGGESGAAFIVGEQNGQLYLLTAAHVIEDATEITVRFQGTNEQQARVVNSDADLDIAAIACPLPAGFVPVSYPVSPNGVRDDQGVVIIGHPFGNYWDINKINQIKESAFGIIPGRFTVYPTGIGPGSSGGPVLNPEGQLLGLITETDPVKTVCVQGDVLLRACKKWLVPVNKQLSATPNSEPPVEEAPDTYTDPLAGTMVLVKGGTFRMGSNEGHSREKPVHRVSVRDFYIGKYEVTQAQWQAVMGNNPSYFKDCDQCPVEQVSWEDVHDFLRKLNEKTGKIYRLPTEAEWEYAAGGGAQNRSKWAGTNTENELDEYAWYSVNSNLKTHPVGTKKANGLGLHDMSGNVWEWCSDWYGDYSSSGQTNPIGPPNGTHRVYRGGGWGNNAGFCRVAGRGFAPSNRYSNLGFRLVRQF